MGARCRTIPTRIEVLGGQRVDIAGWFVSGLLHVKTWYAPFCDSWHRRRYSAYYRPDLVMTSEGPRAQSDNASPPTRRSSWTAARVIGMVFAGFGGLIGLALLVGGIAVLAVYAFERDDDGFFTTDRHRLGSATHAITSQDIDLGDEAVNWAPDEVLGDVRIQVEAARPVFVGIGPDTAVDRYLADVAHDELVDFHGDDPEFVLHEGGKPRVPATQDFWVAQSEGTGEQELTWEADFGRWEVVVMNADAARGVDVEADVGVKLDWAIWVGLGMFVVGLLMSAGAAAVIVLLGRRTSHAPASA